MKLWWDDGGLESSMTPGERLLVLLVRATQKPNIGTRSFLQPHLLQKYISCRIYKTKFQGGEIEDCVSLNCFDGQLWFVEVR